MKLFGWFNMSKKDVDEERELLRNLREVSSASKVNQERIDRIVNIEKVRLKNLELRAEVLSRARVRADG